MNFVKVDRRSLIKKIKTNRDAHRELFIKAQDGFRARVIEELDLMLAEARAGSRIRTSVKLVPPEDHTNEYDRALEMLEMSVEDVVEIDVNSFVQYVRNEWAWFARAASLNSTYSTGGKVDA